MDQFLEALTTFGIPGGLIGLIAFGIRAIIKGDLIPGSTHRLVLESSASMIAEKAHEAQTWREAYERSEAARAVLQEQVKQMMEFSRTSVHVLKSLPTVETGQEHPQP